VPGRLQEAADVGDHEGKPRAIAVACYSAAVPRAMPAEGRRVDTHQVNACGGPLARLENPRMTSDGTSHLLCAILARAIRDLCHADPRVRGAAWQWLWEDPLCVEICEGLGYPVSTLHRAMGLISPPG
jgi:hypothetical protein